MTRGQTKQIGDLIIPRAGNGFLTPTAHERTLDQYNEGRLCARSCELRPQPTPSVLYGVADARRESVVSDE